MKTKRIITMAALLGAMAPGILLADPVIKFITGNPLTNECHTAYTDQGVWAYGGVKAIAANGEHSLALKYDGTVVGWGLDNYGQSFMPAGLSNVVAISTGLGHSLALTGDGRVVGWGLNNYGQTTVPVGLGNAVAISAGRYHSLALQRDGTVIGWGWNNYGQASAPAGLSNVVAIAAGGLHNMALKSDGTVVAWGYNFNGQTTVPADLTNVVAIAAGTYHSLALRSDGTVIGWGRNAEGQVNIPAGLSNVVAIIAGGGYHSLALRNDGTVVGWGWNYYGQATAPAGLSNVIGIAAGGQHSLALQRDGIVVGWGWNPNGQTTVPPAAYVDLSSRLMVRDNLNTDVVGTYLLDYTVSDVAGRSAAATRTVVVADTTPPVVTLRGGNPLTNECRTAFTDPGATAVDASGGAGAVAAGNSFSLGLRSDGTVFGWGLNDNGQTSVPKGLSNFVAIAAGYQYSLGLKADGTVTAWGRNSEGQTSVPLAGGPVLALAAGRYHGLALHADGTVLAWGKNSDGQTSIPAGLSNVLAVAAGEAHSLALCGNGTVVAWGRNNDGQSSVPATLSNVVALAAGGTHSLALRGNGTVVAWGRNNDGQSKVPPTLSNVVAVAAGGAHSLALCSNGTVVAWGRNNEGQATVPATLSNVMAIAAGGAHSLALRSDCSVIGWGRNTEAQTTVPPSLNTDLTSNIRVTGSVNTNVPGRYGLTYSVADLFGNQALTNRAVIVVDTRPPVPSLASLPTLTGQCAVSVPTPTANDAGAGVIRATTSDPTSYTSPGAYIVHWVYADGSGNTITQTQTVVVRDTLAPTIVCPTNVVIEAPASTNVSVTGQAAAIDNCDPNPTVSFTDVVASAACPKIMVISRTWTARDVSGNASSCVQTITVTDTTKPVLVGVPANITVGCDSVPTPAPVTAIDNRGVAPVITFAETRVNGNCAYNYTLKRTWTAKDACGNTASQTQTITVKVLTPPIIIAPADVVVALSGSASTIKVTLGTPTAFVPCGLVKITNNAPSYFPIGRTVVTWTATDACGNTATSQQRVVVTKDVALSNNFNSTAIAASNTLWFSSTLKVCGLGSKPVSVWFYHQQISSSNGLIAVSVPDAQVIFDPKATCASTCFNGKNWLTIVPASLAASNTFFSGVALPLPGGLPADLKNITWKGTVVSDTSNLSVQWSWAAAAYTNFPDRPCTVGVKAADDSRKDCAYQNADRAGTPELAKTNLVPGATGSGGTNYTGNLSGAMTLTPRQGTYAP